MNRRKFLGIAITAPAIVCECIENRQSLRVCVGDDKGGRCRYLDKDEQGHVCLKLSPPHRTIIDEEVANYLKIGLSLIPDAPLGDNCSGCSPHMRLV